jgi:hypothetical protein
MRRSFRTITTCPKGAINSIILVGLLGRYIITFSLTFRPHKRLKPRSNMCRCKFSTSTITIHARKYTANFQACLRDSFFAARCIHFRHELILGKDEVTYFTITQ